MNKTNISKSFYTTSFPSTICKELHREFHLPYAEVINNDCDIPDYRLVTVIAVCYKKDVNDILSFLQRFNAER